MARYRRTSVVVEANHFQWKDGQGIPDIAGVKFTKWRDVVAQKPAPVVETAYIETSRGKHPVSRGDWIIRDIDGEFSTASAEDFESNYEAAD